MKAEEYLTFARRMRAAGILLHIKEDDEKGPQAPPKGLLIRQVGGVIESSAFDIHPCGMGYRISVRITSNLTGAFAISAFGLDLPWEDSNFNWLADPIEYEVHPPTYRFRGKLPLEYPREMAINHCANVTRTMSQGQSVEGYLLASGGPMPEKIRHGEMIPAIVNVFDQFDRKYSASFSLWADRSEKNLGGTHKKAPKKSLLECPDPGYDYTPVSEEKART